MQRERDRQISIGPLPTRGDSLRPPVPLFLDYGWPLERGRRSSSHSNGGWRNEADGDRTIDGEDCDGRFLSNICRMGDVHGTVSAVRHIRKWA
ncbi:hypothetical protein Y046_6038 [Burkholderia pseudomallei MSHR2990]|nr:hypothetical protein Y046_6038 [Burkholderia pseudomallei MSHR2990]